MLVNDRNELGGMPSRPVSLTALGFGGAGLGNLFQEVSDEVAVQTISAATSSGIDYFDTAPFYGFGLSEERLGAELKDAKHCLSTKVGRIIEDCVSSAATSDVFVSMPPKRVTFDYSYDGIMKSFNESVARLNREPDILLVHDLDVATHGEDRFAKHIRAFFDGKGYQAMCELKAANKVAAIGAGLNSFEGCETLCANGAFDCFMVAGRYTLLEQEALDSCLPRLQREGIGVVLGGPFNSGILATGAIPEAKFNYRPATAHIMSRVKQIELICQAHSVPLIAAALQFPAAHPVIKCVACGAQSPVQVLTNVRAFEFPIPSDFWAELRSEGILHPDATLP